MRGSLSVMLVAVVGLVAGTRVHADAKQDADNRKIMHAYATCVVKKRHDAAAEVILANEGIGTILRRHSDLIDSDCLSRARPGVDMSFKGDLYRYALADALVNSDYAAVETKDFADRLPLAQQPLPDRAKLDAELATAKSKGRRKELEDNFMKASATIWLSRLGECIVRADPTGTRLWLLTPPGLPEETSRISALQPAFAACLDRTARFNRVTLRGAVALNYYRLAKATPVPHSGT